MRARRHLLACATSLWVLSACQHPAPAPEPLDAVLPLANDNSPFVLSDHRKPSMVVYFFSTWCIPCQLSDPEVAEAYREGVNVVGIAMDLEGAVLVRPWLRSVAPPYPVLIGGGSVASGRSAFGVIPELPALLFLDGKGRPALAVSGVVPAAVIVERAHDVAGR